MNEEFKAKVNYYLQQNELEKALSLLNRYRENTPEFQQLEKLCLDRLSEPHLHLIKEHIQNNRIKEAKALIEQYRNSFGTNDEIERLNTYLAKPSFVLKLEISIKRILENLRNTTVLSGIKFVFWCIFFGIIAGFWSAFVYTILPELDWDIKVSSDILLMIIAVPMALGIFLLSLTFSYIVQNRITQYRLLEDRYHKIEIVTLLIISMLIPPLFYFYLYRQGYPIWRKVIGVGLAASIFSILSAISESESTSVCALLLFVIYFVMLYMTAKKYNL